MPNVGKPSKGCKNCRDRKVKCDQKRPSCSQCLRINKECHGYRDPLALMFKNESDVVAKKAKIRYQELSKGKAPKSGRGQSQSSDVASASSSSRSPAPSDASETEMIGRESSLSPKCQTWTLVPSIDDQSIHFFFSNYVIPVSIVPRGQFDYLPELFNQSNSDRTLQSSLLAAGLAGLGNAMKSASMLKRAQEEYVSALHMTNQALQCPHTAMKDTTLASVLMLGMYENFSFQTKRSLKSWTKHVKGAAALVMMRGMDQLKRPMGVRIFQQFYGNIMLICAENRIEVPSDLSNLWDTYSAKFGDYSVPGRTFTVQIIKWMRQSINLSTDAPKDPLSTVAAALQHLRSFKELLVALPEVWKYQKIYVQEPLDEVYGNQYHIYSDPWITYIWINARALQLILLSNTRDQLIKGSLQIPPLFTGPKVTQQIKKCEADMMEVCLHIVAFAPQMLGEIPYPTSPPTSPPQAGSSSASSSSASSSSAGSPPPYLDPCDPQFRIHRKPFGVPATIAKANLPTGMHNLIWPLYLVGEMDFCPEDLRQWVIKTLYVVGLRIGTKQAIVLADDLKEKRRGQVQGWVHELNELRDFDSVPFV